MSTEGTSDADDLRAEKIVLWVMLLNFVAFCFIAAWLGGDAINGYSEAGRYYVAMNGQATEVSAGIFIYSRWHAISVIASFGAAFSWQLWIIWREVSPPRPVPRLSSRSDQTTSI